MSAIKRLIPIEHCKVIWRLNNWKHACIHNETWKNKLDLHMTSTYSLNCILYVRVAQFSFNKHFVVVVIIIIYSVVYIYSHFGPKINWNEYFPPLTHNLIPRRIKGRNCERSDGVRGHLSATWIDRAYPRRWGQNVAGQARLSPVAESSSERESIRTS